MLVTVKRLPTAVAACVQQQYSSSLFIGTGREEQATKKNLHQRSQQAQQYSTEECSQAL